MGRKVWVIPPSEEPHPDEMLAESTIRMVEMGTHQYVKSQNGSTWSLDPIAGVTLTNGSRGQVGHVAERGRLDRDSSELSIWGGHLSVLLDCCHMRMPIQSGQRNPSPHFYPKCFRFKTLKIIPLKKKHFTDQTHQASWPPGFNCCLMVVEREVDWTRTQARGVDHSRRVNSYHTT